MIYETEEAAEADLSEPWETVEPLDNDAEGKNCSTPWEGLDIILSNHTKPVINPHSQQLTNIKSSS